MTAYHYDEPCDLYGYEGEVPNLTPITYSANAYRYEKEELDVARARLDAAKEAVKIAEMVVANAEKRVEREIKAWNFKCNSNSHIAGRYR